MLKQEQLPSWLQHPGCFSESVQGLWEDTETECVHHCIEGVVRVWQGCHIACTQTHCVITCDGDW